MAKFRKRPVVIEAVQLRWDNWNEMCEHAGVGNLSDGRPEGTTTGSNGVPFHVNANGPGLAIPTLEGLMIANPMDWIIRGVEGEIYPCKPDIFEKTYESVDDAPTARAAVDHDG